MARIEGVCRAVFDETEWVAIATHGEEGPHLAGTWGDYLRSLSELEEDRLLVPVGGMAGTEGNLLADPRVELLLASRRVQGSHGPGQGCLVRGRGRLEFEGGAFERMKKAFPWARALLVVEVEEAATQL